MKLVIYPDLILRQKAKEVKDDNLEELFKELVTGMINYGGVGLAAPQIGIGKRAAVISEKASDKLEKPILLINPVILEKSGHQSIEEGCLSVLGINAHVPRFDRIKVETGPANDRNIIEADGMLSIVIQHEIDHLNGILFPDRLNFARKYWYLYKAKLKKNKNT